MKKVFNTGDRKVHQYTVIADDFATFSEGTVHPVCSTFVLAREIEWSSRLFVLEMTEEDEEGIGTMLQITHKSPALEKETLVITAVVERWEQHELICNVRVKVGTRLVATGKTGQKILKKEKIKQIFSSLEK